MRIANFPIAVVVAALLVMGCGGSDGGGSDAGGSDEEAITQVVDQFNAAVGQENGEAACSYLSETGQRAFGVIRGVLTCEDMLGGGVGGSIGALLDSLPSLTVSKVTVTGDTATVAFDGTTTTYTLIRDGDGWLIDDVSG